jgi:hypothetical protein
MSIPQAGEIPRFSANPRFRLKYIFYAKTAAEASRFIKQSYSGKAVFLCAAAEGIAAGADAPKKSKRQPLFLCPEE